MRYEEMLEKETSWMDKNGYGLRLSRDRIYSLTITMRMVMQEERADGTHRQWTDTVTDEDFQRVTRYHHIEEVK